MIFIASVCHLLQIEGCPLVTLSYNEICDMLAQRITVRLIMISPAIDGSPRRGCADPHCPAVSCDDDRVLLTPETFSKQSVK